MKAPEYIVLKDFADLQDNKHFYRAGDSFPRTGTEVSEERVAELASINNKCHQALIAKVEVELVSTVEPKKKKSRKAKNA